VPGSGAFVTPETIEMKTNPFVETGVIGLRRMKECPSRELGQQRE